MRVFFAIEFEEKIKNYLFNIQEQVRQECLSGNYTSKENLHLTLRFIGEQSTVQVEKLKAALNEAAHGPAFELKFHKPGNFEKGNRKIIWLGLQESSQLRELYSQLESMLARYGYQKEERNYSPHITLAREVKTDNFERLMEKIAADDGLAVKVGAISLMESKRIDNKLCYVPLARAEFANDRDAEA